MRSVHPAGPSGSFRFDELLQLQQARCERVPAPRVLLAKRVHFAFRDEVLVHPGDAESSSAFYFLEPVVDESEVMGSLDWIDLPHEPASRLELDGPRKERKRDSHLVQQD